MTELTGQNLGRYHILAQLGEGGMASVYQAVDTLLKRPVAIKVILPQRRFSEMFIKRFEREARALAQLSHPNIVKVLDYGEEAGLPFLVMEYLPGGTLKQKLGQQLAWREAVNLVIPIARALAYAHEQQIVHRDVKPANILLTQSGEPMLSDFGIAKILETEETTDLTGTGVGIGTPDYMAPEQGTNEAVDRRADILPVGAGAGKPAGRSHQDEDRQGRRDAEPDRGAGVREPGVVEGDCRCKPGRDQKPPRSQCGNADRHSRIE